MLTLYQQTDPIKDATGSIVGYESKPVLFPDTFPLLSGLKFDWANNIVERNGKKYYMDRYTELAENIPSIDKWKSIYGNSIENTYYTGLLSEHDANPSGNVTNIKRSVYKSLGVIKYILDFTYDANDNVIKIESIAPSEIAAGEFDDIVDEIIDDSQRLPINNLKITPFYGYDDNNGVMTIVPKQSTAFVSQTARRKPIFTDGIQIGNDVARIRVSFGTKFTGNTAWVSEVWGVDASGKVIHSDKTTRNVYDISNVSRNIKFLCIFVIPINTPLENIKSTILTQYNLGLNVELSTERVLFIENENNNAAPQFYDCENNEVVSLAEIVESRLLVNITTSGTITAVPDGFEDVATGNRYALDAEIVMNKDLHLKVHYSGAKTLTIYNNNGTPPITKKYFFNDDITLEVPTKEGNEFMYYTNSNGDILADTFRIDRDTTITAQWRTI